MSFTYLAVSDVHLGHRNTSTTHILHNLKTQLLTTANTTVNAIFINGDLFDRLLDLNSPDVHEILDFFNYLLNYCVSNNILLRVLEGTPSHDNRQSKLLDKLNQMRITPCNLVYHKQLAIEYLPTLNKHILYIPDEWTDNLELLHTQIKEQLNQHNIHQVDACMLHGQFSYQVAGLPFKGIVFQESDFLSYCKGFIHIGHHHRYSTFDRIIANGSFDRLAHGEEEPKGYVKVEDTSFCFIENVNAYIYKTIPVRKNTSLERLDKIIYKLPKDAYVRLVFQKDHELAAIFSELRLRYIDYNLSRKLTTTDSEIHSTTYILPEDDIDTSTTFIATADVYKTIHDELIVKHVYSELGMKKLLDYLEPLKRLSLGDTTDVAITV